MWEIRNSELRRENLRKAADEYRRVQALLGKENSAHNYLSAVRQIVGQGRKALERLPVRQQMPQGASFQKKQV